MSMVRTQYSGEFKEYLVLAALLVQNNSSELLSLISHLYSSA